MTDTLSRYAAEQLALRIQRYWADRGYIVFARTELVVGPHGQSCCAYAVRSDMVNGFPRGYVE
jgi:hypothetical protein